MNSPVSLQRIQSDFKVRMLGDDPHPGLAVYRHNYHSQLKACLTDTLVSTRRWLEEDEFAALVIAFIEACPPSSWSLDHYPAGFSAWLGQQEAENLQLAADLARIDWALAEVFVEQDGPALTVGDLSSLDWDHTRLARVPATRVVELNSNAFAVWTALQAHAEVGNLSKEVDGCSIVVWRQQGSCRIRVLEPLEVRYLGETAFFFSELCATAVMLEGEEAGLNRAGGLLARWATEGTVVAVQISSASVDR